MTAQLLENMYGRRKVITGKDHCQQTVRKG